MSDGTITEVQPEFFDVTRNRTEARPEGVTLRALEAKTTKGFAPGKIFFDLQTDDVSLENIVGFIGEENSAVTLKSYIRTFCISAASHPTVKGSDGKIDKVALQQVLTNMEIVRVAKSKIVDELLSIAGFISDYFGQSPTPEGDILMREKAARGRRLRTMLDEIEARSAARKAEGDAGPDDEV